MKGHKVTVITPVYNSERFIREAILSVMAQTYRDIEMILVDDCSTDRSAEIIKKTIRGDNRFRYYRLPKNSGAAAARNYALGKVTGRFVAYLDSDDLWKPAKTEEQVRFMLANHAAFSCTDYEVIDEYGKPKHKTVSIPRIVGYDLFLRNTIIQTVGVMVDVEVTGKELLEMTLLSSREDAATWCQLLKKGFCCHGVGKTLAYYRRVPASLSSNKVKAAIGTWDLYRNIEQLSLIKSALCFVGYAINACKKRIYI